MHRIVFYKINYIFVIELLLLFTIAVESFDVYLFVLIFNFEIV